MATTEPSTTVGPAHGNTLGHQFGSGAKQGNRLKGRDHAGDRTQQDQ